MARNDWSSWRNSFFRVSGVLQKRLGCPPFEMIRKAPRPNGCFLTKRPTTPSLQYILAVSNELMPISTAWCKMASARFVGAIFQDARFGTAIIQSVPRTILDISDFMFAALDVGLDQALRQAMGERHDGKRGVLLAENRYHAAVTDIKVLTLEIFQVLVDHAASRVSSHSAGAHVMNA